MTSSELPAVRRKKQHHRESDMKHREYNILTHVAFIDYIKAFDRVCRAKLWKSLLRKRVLNTLLKLYKCCIKAL